MEENNEKEDLQKYANSERATVVTEGNKIINFDTITALTKMDFTGSNQRVYLINDSTAGLMLIKESRIWDLKENKLIKAIDNEEIRKIVQIAPDVQAELKESNIVITKTAHPAMTLPIKADDAIVTPTSIAFGNIDKIVIVKKTDYSISKEIPFNYPESKAFDKNGTVENMVLLNDNYIAAIINDIITIFDITEGIGQNISTIVLDENKNTSHCIIDLSNGKVLNKSNEHNSAKLKSNANHCCLLIASGIPKRLQVFKADRYESIMKLIEDVKVVRIDKIDNDEHYLFVMADYFYVYDAIKKEYIQKMASLFTSNYCFCPTRFIYFSTPVFYSVNIDMSENNK